jgi:protein phosphatase
MRNELIFQLSVDHTWIQEAIELGLIQPDQKNGHPNAHVIRRYLGSPTLPEVDFRMRLFEGESDQQAVTNQGMRLMPNDRLLLCSDGLTDLVSDAEILTAFREKPMEEAANLLVDLANQRGGHDNITMVAIHIPAAQAKPAKVLPAAASFSRFLVIGCLGAIVLGVLAGGFFGGWILFNRDNTPTPTLPAGTQTTPTLSSQTRTPARTPTGRITQSPTTTNTSVPLEVPSHTPTNGLNIPGPSITPWPTNTPGTPLPVVTVVSP